MLKGEKDREMTVISIWWILDTAVTNADIKPFLKNLNDTTQLGVKISIGNFSSMSLFEILSIAYPKDT